MNDRSDPRPCALSRYAGDFAWNRLHDSARSRFATHLEQCAGCAALVSIALFAAEEASGDYARDAGTSRWAMEVSDRLTPDESDSLGRDIERVLAWRALRCIGETGVSGFDFETALACEREAVRAVRKRLASMRARGCSQAEEILGLVNERSDPDGSYLRLRECDVLAPKPPRLPRAGDRLGRRRVVDWAAQVIAGFPD